MINAQRVPSLLLLLPALLLITCSDDDDDGGSGKDNFPKDYAAAVCNKSFDCCTATDLEGRTKAECLENTEQLLRFALLQQNDARATFDESAAKSCIAGIEAVGCEQWPEGVSAVTGCNAVFVPKVAVGGTCGSSSECINSFCAMEAEADLGVCTAFAGLDMACHDFDGPECGDGLYCDTTCQPQKADGAECFMDDECASGGCNSGECGPEVLECYQGCGASGVTPWLLALLLPVVMRLRRAHSGSRVRAVA